MGNRPCSQFTRAPALNSAALSSRAVESGMRRTAGRKSARVALELSAADDFVFVSCPNQEPEVHLTLQRRDEVVLRSHKTSRGAERKAGRVKKQKEANLKEAGLAAAVARPSILVIEIDSVSAAYAERHFPQTRGHWPSPSSTSTFLSTPTILNCSLYLCVHLALNLRLHLQIEVIDRLKGRSLQGEGSERGGGGRNGEIGGGPTNSTNSTNSTDSAGSVGSVHAVEYRVANIVGMASAHNQVLKRIVPLTHVHHTTQQIGRSI